MALPSRPSARRVGLPSNPSPRSRSLNGRATPDAYSRPSSVATDPASYTHSRATSSPLPSSPLRPQRSLTNLPSLVSPYETRGRAPQLGAVPPVPPLPLVLSKSSRNDLYENGRGATSATSVSSASTDDSMFHNPWPGPASPATSVEEGAEKQLPEPVESKVAPGFGSSLWSRVAEAAGGLTVSVSRAWEANIKKHSGEVTPPGEESRLTRAMKAYHIEKAREPSDLPEWLFNERDRGLRQRATEDKKANDSFAQGSTSPRTTESAIPAAPSRITSPTRIANPRAMATRKNTDDESAATMSRAAQRLKELRDAKATRTPTIRFADSVHPRHAGRGRAMTEEPVPPTSAAPERSLPTNTRPIATPGAVGRRPTAVGLPSSVRPRRT